MSAEQDDKARALAQRVTRRLSAPGDATVDDIAELRAGLSAVLQRLSVLENHLHQPQAHILPVHPSQERFNLAPAVTELVDFLEGAKTCDYEPGHKPCDNCGLCTSRGF